MNAPAPLTEALRASAAPLDSTVLVVPGMHCAGCMAKVERAFGGLPGVHAARVNLTARQVRVEHDPAVREPALVAALAAAGFASQPRGEELAPPPSAVKPLLAPSWLTALPLITARRVSPSASASRSRLSNTMPPPSPRP